DPLVAWPVLPRLHALVVVVHGHGHGLLGLVLADHVRVEKLVDLPRLGQAVPLGLGGAGKLFLDDLPTVADAFHPDTPLHRAAVTPVPAAASAHVPRGRQALAYRRAPGRLCMNTS